jgi:hypothetical protein
LRAFIAAGTYLASPCLAKKSWIHFTEPIISTIRDDTHTDTQSDGTDLLSMPLRWAMIYILSFIKIGFDIQKLIWGAKFTDTDSIKIA